MVDKSAVVQHYNEYAREMENVADFYDWVVGIFERCSVPLDASIVDVGCGTGALLERLRQLGYMQLTGVDISAACLALARERVGGAQLELQDIEQSPLSGQYDAALMTTVVDFLAEPRAALEHVRDALRPGGLFLLSIRNVMAYFPWYHLRFLSRHMGRWPRLRHWFLHLTTPLGLRRNDQPVERMYRPAEARVLLRMAGFRVEAEYGGQILPMLWIPGLPRLTSCVRGLDRTVGVVVPRWLKFRYAFACRS